MFAIFLKRIVLFTLLHSSFLIIRAERDRLIAIEQSLLAQVAEEAEAINKEKNTSPQSKISQISEMDKENENTTNSVDVKDGFDSKSVKSKDEERALEAEARKAAQEHVREWVSVLTEPLNDEIRVMEEEDDVLLDSWSSHKGVSQHLFLYRQLTVRPFFLSFSPPFFFYITTFCLPTFLPFFFPTYHLLITFSCFSHFGHCCLAFAISQSYCFQPNFRLNFSIFNFRN
jgi:hypothetical protein